MFKPLFVNFIVHPSFSQHSGAAAILRSPVTKRAVDTFLKTEERFHTLGPPQTSSPEFARARPHLHAAQRHAAGLRQSPGTTKDSSGAISMASYDPKNTDRTADMAQLLRLAAHMFDDTHVNTQRDK